MNSHNLYFASKNPDKHREIEEILTGLNLCIKPPSINFPPNLESGETLKENAYIKAKFLYDYGFAPVFADDTGLFLPHLGGLPGVNSSRFAGPRATYEENRIKLLNLVKNLGFHQRVAYFKTVICLITTKGNVHFFTGKVEGFIIDEMRGDYTFGYDPLFLYPQLGMTFGELPLALKNKISHRGKAFNQMILFLREHEGSIF